MEMETGSVERQEELEEEEVDDGVHPPESHSLSPLHLFSLYFSSHDPSLETSSV